MGGGCWRASARALACPLHYMWQDETVSYICARLMCPDTQLRRRSSAYLMSACLHSAHHDHHSAAGNLSILHALGRRQVACVRTWKQTDSRAWHLPSQRMEYVDHMPAATQACQAVRGPPSVRAQPPRTHVRRAHACMHVGRRCVHEQPAAVVVHARTHTGVGLHAAARYFGG